MCAHAQCLSAEGPRHGPCGPCVTREILCKYSYRVCERGMPISELYRIYNIVIDQCAVSHALSDDCLSGSCSWLRFARLEYSLLYKQKKYSVRPDVIALESLKFELQLVADSSG